MDSYECMVTSHPFNEDQRASVTRGFFFTNDVTKSEHSIFDRTDEHFSWAIDRRWRDKSNHHAQIYPIYTPILWGKEHSRMFWAIKLFRYLNPWISSFLLLLDSFPRPKSVWKWDFIERIGRICLLNTKFSSF